MDTRQYDSETRKSIKRFQRSPGYAAVKAIHDARIAALEADRAKLAKDLDEQRKYSAQLANDLANSRGEDLP